MCPFLNNPSLITLVRYFVILYTVQYAAGALTRTMENIIVSEETNHYRFYFFTYG